MKSLYTSASVGKLGLALLCGSFLILQSCSSSTRSTYYPYGTTSYSAVYTPPSWAPASGNLTNVRYYYLPDCDAYYDASNQQFYSMSNGAWISSGSVPGSCAGTDLSQDFVVMLNNTTNQPWLNNSFYQSNYPTRAYDAYGNIVVSHNLINNLPQGYAVIPRAFNENTNDVIFVERDPSGNIVLNTVPMSNISPYMPPESRGYYYGGGYPSR